MAIFSFSVPIVVTRSTIVIAEDKEEAKRLVMAGGAPATDHFVHFDETQGFFADPEEKAVCVSITELNANGGQAGPKPVLQ